MNNIDNLIADRGWQQVFAEEIEKPYFKKLIDFVAEERKQYVIFPPKEKVFSAFNATPFDEVKVVILGQDPYHGVGQSHGLCFSVPNGVRKPPSLLNIFKEMRSDLGIPIPQQGNLESWTREGVLLMNSTLTVREGHAGSHQKQGWESFTDYAIKMLSQKRSGIVFLLWGAFAHAKEELIDTSKHYILKTVHPSPLSASRGFFGCRHFSKTNEILKRIKKEPIDWTLENIATLF